MPPRSRAGPLKDELPGADHEGLLADTEPPPGCTLDLTAPQVAERLGMTPAGVYKLIQRGKLDAVRFSARKTRVGQEALDAYIARHQAPVQQFRDRAPRGDSRVLRQRFLKQTGRTPEQWLAAWKRDDIADTAENGQLLVRAVALREDTGAPAPAAT